MPDSSYASLFARIRDHCRKQQWYGPDMIGPDRLHDPQLAKREARSKFVYPPATEEQLGATEDVLVIAVPEPLRALYACVANGGFGPGYGIVGAVGGAPHVDGAYKDIARGYLSRLKAQQTVDLRDFSSATEPETWFNIPSRSWPKYLIPFCDWGCNTEHAIYAPTGQIFAVVDGCCLANWAPSLEVWLERWLDGTLKQE